jgi:hypothetical protein
MITVKMSQSTQVCSQFRPIKQFATRVNPIAPLVFSQDVTAKNTSFRATKSIASRHQPYILLDQCVLSLSKFHFLKQKLTPQQRGQVTFFNSLFISRMSMGSNCSFELKKSIEPE